MTADLIIPAYKPDKTFLEAVDAMASQTLSFEKIIVVNTEQKYFDRLVYSAKFLDEHKSLDVRHISKREFDCGKTCNFGVKISQADCFIIMSQNVVPESGDVAARLIAALENDPKCAVAFARQTVPDKASEIDKYAKTRRDDIGGIDGRGCIKTKPSGLDSPLHLSYLIFHDF